MKEKGFAAFLLILLFVLNFQAQTNRRKKTSLKKAAPIKSQPKKKNTSRVISLGVMNGRAINLVKPKFPPAAKAVNVRGSVNVSILIDEAGNVIEAKAVSGHLLLRANSVAAALKSTFEPVTLSGDPVRVRGTIIYNYISDNFNWLEIGNAFGETYFIEVLPFDFEAEKQMYEQYQTADYENASIIYRNLRAMIENKLSGNNKNLWLFQVGMFLKKFQFNYPVDEDRKRDLIELKTLIANSPENISQRLISRLENLLNLSENAQTETYDWRYGNKIYKQIQSIKEHLSTLGN